MFKKLGRSTYFFIFLLITLVVFLDLPKTFYQQDEWQTLGHNLVFGPTSFLRDTNPILLLFSEKRPLSTLLYSLFLGHFKFTVIPAAIFAILFHGLNSILLFFLVDKLTNKKVIALVASVFFIVNSVSHQAVTWVSAMSTLPATTLILLSIASYLKYLDTKVNKYKILSFLSVIFSLYFKGVGIFLFVLLPLLHFVYLNKQMNKKNIKNLLRENILLFGFALLMVLVRFGEFFFRSEGVAGYVGAAGNSSFAQTVILRSILYPLTSLFQIFVPPLDFYSKTSDIAKIQYQFLIGSPLVDLVAQSAVADMISLLGSMFVLSLALIIAYRQKDKPTKGIIFFTVIFFFLSFLPYVVLNRDSSYLSSRYFYVGTIPAAILLGYLIYFLSSINKYVKWGVLLLVSIYLFHHADIVRADISRQVRLGNERVAVLNGIKNLHSNLSNNTVFYVTSDKEYYGPITNPFQNGLGYVLEVWYYDSGKIPKEFLSENFLWDLGAEGYKRSGNRGFGYYQDMDEMIKDMEKNRFEADIVYGFFINSSDMKVIDITEEVRTRISTISAIAE